MKIIEWEGLHYCQDCGKLVVNEDFDSVEYCDKCAGKRGWNFYNRRRVKVDENGKRITNEGNTLPSGGDSVNESAS